MIGKTLQNGKYEIKRILGQGGFGITYEGVQTGLGRKVAIKEFFMKDFCERETGTSQVTIVGTEGNRSLVERFKEKFIKEAQMIAGLEDVPHIIRIYDIFQENGTAYYVMQFIEGGSLDSKIKKEGAVNESVAIGYITQMADALRQLHEQKIMHLDIKPANVLLRGNDLYLIDFGVSKHYDAEGDATTTTPVGRSKGYAPIEQYRQGGVQSFSPETDIYSLGATAYFLVTGKTPPEATELIIDPIQRPNGISDSLWDAISTSMSPNKNQRPCSIQNFMSLLLNGTKTKFHNSSERLEYHDLTKLDAEPESIELNGKLHIHYIANKSIGRVKIKLLVNGIIVGEYDSKQNYDIDLPLISSRTTIKVEYPCIETFLPSFRKLERTFVLDQTKDYNCEVAIDSWFGGVIFKMTAPNGVIIQSR